MDMCIFEKRPCRFAKKEGNAFNCTAPSDDEMPCRKRTYSSPRRLSNYERTRASVYASGNKWAIENFNATH